MRPRYGFSDAPARSRATTGRLPRPWRTVIDWLITILVAVAFVLAFEAEIAKPYRIPSSSMEPTLHCAHPAAGCEARFSDRVIACEICYRLSGPKREQIVVLHAPAQAATACGEAGVYVKRLIGLPGETIREDEQWHLWVDGRRLEAVRPHHCARERYELPRLDLARPLRQLLHAR